MDGTCFSPVILDGDVADNMATPIAASKQDTRSRTDAPRHSSPSDAAKDSGDSNPSAPWALLHPEQRRRLILCTGKVRAVLANDALVLCCTITLLRRYCTVILFHCRR